MRRTLVALAVAALACGPAVAARAQVVTTTTTAAPTTTTTTIARPAAPIRGSFTNPTRAVAGAPVYVRSITPCPMTPGDYQYVTVYLRPQPLPSSPDEIDYTMADLRPDGSWEVTISAPVDMPDGVTKSYSVHAECTRDDNPYLNDYFDEVEPPKPHEYQRYPLRTLVVTGFGPSTVVEGDGPSGAPTTTVPATTTSVVSNQGDLSAAGVPKRSVAAAVADAEAPATTAEDHLGRWAEIRKELAARDGGTARLSLASAEASAARAADPADGGIPWWAFALATMLAVSAVLAFGTRRTSALRELDR